MGNSSSTINSNICIVAVGYNRPNAMQRLLNSILDADYDGQKVDLMISIDKGQRQDEIIKLAEDIVWPYGKKMIRAFSERQGLRPHIIQCGDLAFEYKAVVVLEDDITVSKGFYSYVSQCVDFYGDDRHIGGISLYKHCINVGVGHFFEPEYNGFDCFMMQYAQSWGECWTTRMWTAFKAWYIENEETFFVDENPLLSKIPNNILEWGNKSWMKYYMGYILQNDLYYIYPYHALSTNHSEAGQHNSVAKCDYQVALAACNIEYRLPNFEQAVKYDMFFERIDYEIDKYSDKNVILDLYGNKKDFGGDILISSKPRQYKVLEQWKLKYRPHEVNCLHPEIGEGLYVYDLHIENKSFPKSTQLIRTRYDIRSLSWKKILKMGLYRFYKTILRKLKLSKT